MVGFWSSALKIVLCFVCLVIAFDYKTEGFFKDGLDKPLELYAEGEINQFTRDIGTADSGLDQSISTTAQGRKVDVKDESKDKLIKRSQPSKHARKFNSRRRCLLGYPHGCPSGFAEFADPLLYWPTPWGWPPGPLYPEYGPNFPRAWARHGGPFGSHSWGLGGPWRGPGCHCGGCNSHGWCCLEVGGGGPVNDCPQCNDEASKSPSSPQRPGQPSSPLLFQPPLAKQTNLKAPLQVKPVKSVRRWLKRYEVPYNTGYQYPYQSSYGNYPYQPSGHNYAYQSTYGSYPYQSSYGSDPYQSGYGGDPYQSSCVNEPCTEAAPQQPSIADQVVGTLFLFKPNGNFLADKHQEVKSKKEN